MTHYTRTWLIKIRQWLLYEIKSLKWLRHIECVSWFKRETMLSELVFFRYIQLLLYFFSSFFCIFLDFFIFYIFFLFILYFFLFFFVIYEYMLDTYIQNIYISIVIGVTEGSNGPWMFNYGRIFMELVRHIEIIVN